MHEQKKLHSHNYIDCKVMKCLTFLHSENQAIFELEQVKSDMIKLNDQLLEAVQQKLALSEQLEMWQVCYLPIVCIF